MAEQPEVGGGQGHHLQACGRHPFREPDPGLQGQQAHAAGMAAGHGHATALALDQAGEQGQAGPRGGRPLIDMQVHGAAQPFGQAQQGQEVSGIAGAPAEGRPQHPPQQAARPGHPPGQLQPRRARPEGDWHQGHQLQLEAAPPALLQLQQGLPAGLGRRTGAVHMAAQAPQAIAPGPIQGRFAPLQHLVGRALLRFAAIGGQGRRHGGGLVREGAPAEGLIKMDVGIHGRRDRQGSGGLARPCGAGLDGLDAASVDGQAHRDQPLAVARRQLR